MGVVFNEAKHQYFNEDTGEEYESVSKIIKKYVKVFDSNKIAGFVAAKQGKTKQEVLDEWSSISKKATDSGTLIHAAMEKFMKGDENWRVSEHADAVENFIPLNPIRKKSSVQAECRLYNHEYKIAGTSDLIEDIDSKFFNVYDFKSNKELKFESYKDESMLSPLEFLPSSSYIIYSLQLSIYAYMYSKLTGKEPRRLGLYHFDQTTRKWMHIPVSYMKYEVLMLLDDYKEHREHYLRQMALIHPGLKKS